MGNISVDLKGKTALVTGAGKGIGRGIALALAGCGAKVAAVARTREDLESLQAEIGSEQCFIATCDVSSVVDIRDMVDKVIAWAGKIDILVNSAGINIQANALDVTEEQWDKIMNTNLKGSFFCSQAVARTMVPHNAGKIINITSQMAFVGFYRRAAYCASKGGVSQFTKVLAVELAPNNINVNCVAPTFINTPLTEPMFKEKAFYDEVIRRIPLQRVGEVDDVVGAVLYLASDMANLVTGTSIVVDGGWVAW
jgi:NAD(P)-dependent dehydrogenase (short-subunit alcohol dehydrogenase family)